MYSVLFIYFDTSAINALYDDAEPGRVVAGLMSIGQFRTSSFIVNEIAGTRDLERRLSLLILTSKLAEGTVPLQLPHLIVRRILRAYASGQTDFSAEVAPDDDALRVLRSPALATDVSRDLASEWTSNVEQLFDSIAVSMRERAQTARPRRQQPYFSSISSLIRHLMFDPGETFRKFVAAMYLAETGQIPEEFTLMRLVEHPAWRLSFGSFVFALHRRSMRAERYARWRNAGGIDLQQAVYLAFCDHFVTADVQQFRALRLLNVLNRHANTSVWRYSNFRAQFQA